jgi:hypothetical protein
MSKRGIPLALDGEKDLLIGSQISLSYGFAPVILERACTTTTGKMSSPHRLLRKH